jgi:hypothetical protein
MKSELQKDYEKITDFRSDWLTPLMEKYGLTEEEVLDSINY